MIEKITDNKYASLELVISQAMEIENIEENPESMEDISKIIPLLSRQISDEGNTQFHLTGLKLKKYSEVIKNYMPAELKRQD